MPVLAWIDDKWIAGRPGAQAVRDTVGVNQALREGVIPKIKSPLKEPLNPEFVKLEAKHTVAVGRHCEKAVAYADTLVAAVVGPQVFHPMLKERLNMVT